MPDLMLSAQQIFENPEFDAQLGEWQQILTTAKTAEAELSEQLYEEYKDPDVSENGTIDRISILMEQLDEVPDEELEASFHFDLLSAPAADLLLKQRAAQKVQRQAEATLLGISRANGLNEFALHGLRTYLGWADSGDKTYLLDKVATTEKRLTDIDHRVRENTGQLVIYADGIGAYTGKLGIGGLRVIDGQANFPVESAFAASFYLGTARIFNERRLAPNAHMLEREQLRIITPADLLRADKWYTENSLAFGGMPDGPINASGLRAEDVEYYSIIIARIRTIARLALEA